MNSTRNYNGTWMLLTWMLLTMEVITLLMYLAAVSGCAQGLGAGRAFPVDSENYAIDLFRDINPYIEWDESNFLVDLSGLYANCKWLDVRGFVTVESLTPDGLSVSGYTDDIGSEENYVDAVHGTIMDMLDKWSLDPQSEIYEQISVAERFGCSVRPGCSGRASVGCLFAPQTERRRLELKGGTETRRVVPGPGIESNGLAFTKEQYSLAETRLRIPWDRSYFLEDLTGLSIDCGMVGQRYWNTTSITNEATRMGVKVQTEFGSSLNLGETQPAMMEVISSVRPINAYQMGCSLIPDCMIADRMWVVVCCAFQS